MTTYQEKQNACVNQLYSDLTNMHFDGVTSAPVQSISHASTVHNSPQITSKKGKMRRQKGPVNIIQGMLPMSTTEYAKFLRKHSLDIIDEAQRSLLAARVRAEGIMESKASEERFSEQERVNLEGMYQGSVEENI